MDDRYQIIRCTAELPFGSQFEATDDLINRKAQIHRFSKPGKGAPKDWEDLYNKRSGALTTINHMGLPIIYDRGINDKGPFLIRQYIDEPTLISRLEESPLNEYEVWELAQQMLDIHNAALEKGFYHGSLSPERICYATRPGGEKRYYITDFGLGELHNLIHGTNEYFGLPCLICRRQANGGAPSEVSEIFSIGQLLYLCLADNHPFASNKVCEMVELHKNYPLVAIHKLRDDIPKPMSDWLVKMTAVNPDDRFQTYAEALEALPDPIQSAPIPIIPTLTQPQAILTNQATALQQTLTPQTGTQGVVYTTATQPQNVAGGHPESAIKQFLKEPLILGCAALAIILGIVGFFVLRGDDDSDTATSNSSQTEEVDKTGTDGDQTYANSEEPFRKGLLAALNFDDSLVSKNNRNLKLEPLKSPPVFGEGLYGKGLLLDCNHFYRFPLQKAFDGSEVSEFTISFWVKNMENRKAAFISDQPWKDGEFKKLSNKDSFGKDRWQWTPPNQISSNNDASNKGWDMVSLVFSRNKQQVRIYQNGEYLGSSSADSIKTLDGEKYLYIGCDSEQYYSFTNPVNIDQLYIWNRRLSSKEISEIYKQQITM